MFLVFFNIEKLVFYVKVKIKKHFMFHSYSGDLFYKFKLQYNDKSKYVTSNKNKKKVLLSLTLFLMLVTKK